MSPYISLAVLVLYFCIILVIAKFTARGSKTATFFNADHSSPWYLVAFGTIGATISGVTFVSVPGEVGTTAWHYIQFIIGNFLGYWIIAFILIPLYYRLKLISIYDYLRQRFGETTHRTGAVFFLISQMAGASFRLFLVIGVLQILVFDALNVPFIGTAMLVILMIWLYIRRAGIKTVVWTDTLQTICIVVAAVMTVYAIIKIANFQSITELTEAIVSHSTFDIWDTDFRSPTFAVKQILAGIGIVIVMNGLDQNMMQKSLTCPSKTEAQINICSFSFAFIIANILFLALGTSLYIFAERVGMQMPSSTDDLFPLIVTNYMPTFIEIIFLLGIVAASFSSADSSLTALTTVWCIDILRLDPDNPETVYHRNRIIMAMATTMFAVVCLFHVINDRSIVSAIFTVAGYTYGPLLGLFAYGILTKRTLNDKFTPYICVAAPILSYLFSHFIQFIFNGYRMGFELLLLNASIVFVAVYLTGKNKT